MVAETCQKLIYNGMLFVTSTLYTASAGMNPVTDKTQIVICASASIGWVTAERGESGIGGYINSVQGGFQ